MQLASDLQMLYNVTVDMKIDVTNNKVWSQVNYTSPFFGTDELMQLALLPNDKNVSLKINDECKWAKVNDVSYIYLRLIFNSWNYYTKYIGLNDDGLHEYHLIDIIQKTKVGNLTFLFEDMGEESPVELVKIGITSSSLGQLWLNLTKRVTEETFTDDDFNYGEIM